jgi:hypothetical protein
MYENALVASGPIERVHGSVWSGCGALRSGIAFASRSELALFNSRPLDRFFVLFVRHSDLWPRRTAIDVYEL